MSRHDLKLDPNAATGRRVEAQVVGGARPGSIPVKLPIRGAYRDVVDAGVPLAHLSLNGAVGTLVCHGDTVELSGSTVLACGTTWQVFGFTCRSANGGLTCTNGLGHGFFLARNKQMVF